VNALTAEMLALGAATLGESGARPMHPRIKPAWPAAAVAGRAVTVRCAPADNLAIHAAVASAAADTVLVVDASALPARGYWGEVLTTAAQARGVAGLVIDGGVRDVAALTAHGFPVFSARVALPGASKVGGGSVDRPVRVGDVLVEPGDWVVGDVDGVVVIPAAALDRVVAAGLARAEAEQRYFDRLRAGETTGDLLGLDFSTVARDAMTGGE